MINISGHANLLDALPASVERLFFASTAAVYPPKEGEHVEASDRPMDIYGATKGPAMALCARLGRGQLDNASRSARLFTACGLPPVNQPASSARHHGSLNAGVSARSAIAISNAPRYLDARDMARANPGKRATLSPRDRNLFNTARTGSTAVVDVARFLARHSGRKIGSSRSGPRPQGRKRPSLLEGSASSASRPGGSRNRFAAYLNELAP